MKSSFIPELDIRILREFTRYRYKRVSMKSGEKNRFQNAFTVCNVALDSVVTDMFGKSATTISVRISRTGVCLKPALVQAAHAAVKDKAHPYYALKYERIAKRRGKKRAIIAIARMILTAICSMFSTGEVWNPTDLCKIDMPQALKEKQLAKAINQAIRFLEKQGLSVAWL